MKLSVSILGIEKDIKNKIEELNKLDVDYLHLDIMDGKFVPNSTGNFESIREKLNGNTKPIDLHLMVENPLEYIKRYEVLNPEYVTFHYEINDDINRIINYLKEHNIKVGMSIKPTTDPALILPYIDKLDLVLVMTVEPGFGGQKFIDMSYKINELISIRKNGNLEFKIEVDGGINDTTIELVKDVDISVVGSFITSSDDYKQNVKILKEKIHDRKTY